MTASSFGRVACATTLTICSALHLAHAKPIAFADGTTVMAEYGAGTMTEVQAFYAPTFRYSVGGGHLSLNSDINDNTRDITYVRFNYLPKRWNLESAQANVFTWGSVGRAHIGETGDNQFAWNLGGQVDYVTRRVYASLRTDLHEASAYSHRIDTLQLGIAPYPHDYQTLALWFVVQARQYTGDLYDGTECAALIRLFKRNAWLEAGATQLVCCVLPAVLVSLGAGAVLVGLVSAVPQLIWLSEHKVIVFGIAAALLVISGAVLWNARRLPCPTDPVAARNCNRLRRVSHVLFGISAGFYLLGALFAFALPG